MNWPIQRVMPTSDELRIAVRTYNSRLSNERSDMKTWRVATETWQALESANSHNCLIRYTSRVAVWGGIRGCGKGDREKASCALWEIIPSLRRLRGKQSDQVDMQTICKLLTTLVEKMKQHGVIRSGNHYSYASKMLHWLLPHLFPIYDERVRQALGICFEGRLAYQLIAEWEHGCADKLHSAAEDVVGDVQPRTLLRAIDKYLRSWADDNVPRPK